MFSPGKEFYPSDGSFFVRSCSRLAFGQPVLLFRTSKDNSKGNKFLHFSVSLLVVWWDANINTKTDSVSDDDDDDDDINNNNNSTSGNLMFYKEQNVDVC